jgi:hypothetical protein
VSWKYIGGICDTNHGTTLSAVARKLLARVSMIELASGVVLGCEEGAVVISCMFRLKGSVQDSQAAAVDGRVSTWSEVAEQDTCGQLSSATSMVFISDISAFLLPHARERPKFGRSRLSRCRQRFCGLTCRWGG